MVTEKNYKKSDQQFQAPPSVRRGCCCSVVSNSLQPHGLQGRESKLRSKGEPVVGPPYP